ncbi:MAG TPA: hypothetical protein VIF62_19455 [Labilithrix sp.]|jgi:hypothetical protein
MRSNATTALAALVAIMSFACGGAPPPQPQPVAVPKTSAPTPPPPTRARWVFAHPERGLSAKLDLGSDQVLYAGFQGRRTMAKGAAALEDAPTLALEHLTGILREPTGDFAFVADDGDVYVSKDALGTLDTIRNGPLGDVEPAARFSSVATGKAAIVGVASDGRMFRTADYGRTWQAVDWAGSARSYGKAFAVAMDTKGNGLLLVLPQRLYVTQNDGASWQQIPSPGIGARAVRRDGADKIFLEGWTERAKLDGGRLAITTEAEEPLRKLPTGTQADLPTKSVFTGDHVVDLVFHKGARPVVEVMSHAIGEPGPKSGVQSPDLVSSLSIGGTAGISANVAGFGSTLLYARADDTKDDSGAVTTTVLRSSDYGSTWKTDATFKGHVVESHPWNLRAKTVAVGPSGWSFVKTMCPPNVGEQNEACTHKQVRPAGSTAFEDLASVEDFAPVDFAFDEPHGKVYVLAAHENRLHVYESSLSQNKFTRTKVLDIPADLRVAIGVDPQGVVRAMSYDAQTRQWQLHRAGADGSEMPPLYVSIDSGNVALSGARGIIAGDHRSYETSDGGETWSRVAASGGGEVACNDAGCVMGGAERTGWDLPAYQSPEKVTASSEPKKPPSSVSRPTVATPAPLELTCKAAGANTPVAFTPGFDTADLRANDVRWWTVKDEKSRTISVVTGGRNGTREVQLLGPEPAKPATATVQTSAPLRTYLFRQLDGVVAVRIAASSPTSETQNVDVVGWSLATNKITRKSLPNVKGLGKFGSIAAAHVVEGGLVVQVLYSDPVRFFRDDGKEETFPAPSGISMSSVVRAENRWIVPMLSGGTAKLTFSDDAGKTWKTKIWRLDDWATPSLGKLGGKTHVAIQPTSMTTPNPTAMLLFSLDSIGDDPPTPVVIASGASDKACDASAATFRTSLLMTSDQRPVQVKIEDADKSTATARAYVRLAHPSQGGALCTSAFQMSGSAASFLYEDAKGFTGYRFKSQKDPKDSSKWQTVAEPLTCSEAAKKP